MNSRRAATTIEYAVILVAVLLLAGGAWKLLGDSLSKRSSIASETVSVGGPSGGSAGSGAGATRGGGLATSGGAGGADDKARATSKVTVGGIGGAAGESGGDGHHASVAADNDGSGSNANGGDAGGPDLTEGLTMKRWFAIGLLAAGVLAIGYVGFSMRRAKKASDASDAPNVTPNGPAPPAA